MERRESVPPSRWGWLALAACVVAAIAQVPIEFDHGEPATPPSVATPESTSTVSVPQPEPAQIGEDPAAAPTALAPAGRESSVQAVSGDALTHLLGGASAPTAQYSTPRPATAGKPRADAVSAPVAPAPAADPTDVVVEPNPAPGDTAPPPDPTPTDPVPPPDPTPTDPVPPPDPTPTDTPPPPDATAPADSTPPV